MNIKLHEIIQLNYELNGVTKIENEVPTVLLEGLLRQKLSLKVKMYLNRLNKLVSDEINLFEEQKKNVKEQSELNELLNADKEVDIRTLWGDDLTIDAFENIETNEVYPVFFKLIDK
jgi:hypothetical protein